MRAEPDTHNAMGLFLLRGIEFLQFIQGFLGSGKSAEISPNISEQISETSVMQQALNPPVYPFGPFGLQEKTYAVTR